MTERHLEGARRSDWLVGYHAVLAALEGGRTIDLVWVQQGRRDRRGERLVELARALGVPVRRVPRARLDELAGGVAHNGCAARSTPVALTPLDTLVAPPGEPARLLLLDGVADPHNLGAVVRTAAAFAVDGVVVAGPAAPPLGAAAAKAAAGLLERVPIARVTVAGDALARLRRAGYWVFAADPAGTPASQVKPIDRWVLCVGAEARGLRAKTRSQVDEPVAIEMAPGVESLNLSVAAGIVLFALCRE